LIVGIEKTAQRLKAKRADIAEVDRGEMILGEEFFNQLHRHG